MNGIATLGKDENFSVFSFADKTIRFRAPYSLEGYTAVKQWDHGYLVVMAKYRHNHELICFRFWRTCISIQRRFWIP